ncbi:MAG: hypothetical protein GY816_12610 [Cytophagales bacterium]|nr:hypothetical protein [Cytophagales bacterium]
MKQVFILIILMVIIGCSDENEAILKNELFVGNWITIQVTKDGALQTEWIDTNLVIEQSNESGGTYQMIYTPYDSIWSPNGSWSILEEQSTFVLDDNISAFYWIKNDTLYLTKYLPWTSIPCEPSEDEPCLLVVTGQWNFIFKKDQ